MVNRHFLADTPLLLICCFHIWYIAVGCNLSRQFKCCVPCFNHFWLINKSLLLGIFGILSFFQVWPGCKQSEWPWTSFTVGHSSWSSIHGCLDYEVILFSIHSGCSAWFLGLRFLTRVCNSQRNTLILRCVPSHKLRLCFLPVALHRRQATSWRTHIMRKKIPFFLRSMLSVASCQSCVWHYVYRQGIAY